jgi:molecular chaperone DnaJ
MSVYQEVGVMKGASTLRNLVQELNKLIAAEPSNPQLYFRAGEVLDEAGFFQKAHQYITKAEALDPSGAFLAEFRSKRYHRHHDRDGCDICDAVCGLCVLDSCCECMGGDIIECC